VAAAQQKKPAPADAQYLAIWVDDIGFWNISAYNQGMMGYKTLNIDRIAKEGALFTDWYGQQSCTAGRAAFSRAVAVTPSYQSRPAGRG
jgi:arylsulfatase